jgi:hypothetical protein
MVAEKSLSWPRRKGKSKVDQKKEVGLAVDVVNENMRLKERE